MKIFFSLVIFLFLVPGCSSLFSARAQNTIGWPSVTNYSSMDYKGGAQTSDIAQDQNGILYFANDDGLLTFNGRYWKIYALPNKAQVKAIAVDNEGRIYVGGHDELGYFAPGKQGTLVFHSLRSLVPAGERQFADIWNIVFHGKEVFFRTNESIFRLKDNKITTFDAPGGWRLLANVGTRLFAEDKRDGFVTFSGNKWVPVIPGVTNHLKIKAITLYRGDTLLVYTMKDGLFLLSGTTLFRMPSEADPYLTSAVVNCARQISADRFMVGTISGGCYIIDLHGRLVQKFSRREGIQNNNIKSIFLDRDHNLWLALENGVDFIAYSSAVTRIHPDREDQVNCGVVRIFDGKLFVGTSNGLYFVPLDFSKSDLSFSKGTFTPVPNTKGMVWGLSEVNRQLLLGHNDGGFAIRNNQPVPLTTQHGVFNFFALPGGEALASTYTGLELLSFKGGSFADAGKVNGIYEALRYVAIDRQTVWASHSFRGVFRLRLSADHRSVVPDTLYGKTSGLPSNVNNFVFPVRGRVVIATGKGIYEFDETHKRFRPSPLFKPVFQEESIRYLVEDDRSNIWFVSNQRVGVVDFHKPNGKQPFTIIYFPEITAQNQAGYGYIYPYNQENVFIGSGKGVYHLNYSKYSGDKVAPTVSLSAVKAVSGKDSLIFDGYFFNGKGASKQQEADQIVSLPSRWNSFHFEYSPGLYGQNDHAEFSYQLSGFDKGWSDWSSKTEKDYTNLPYGMYTFSVKVRNNLGAISKPVQYTFIVQPAWYETAWAYLCYALLAGWVIYLLTGQQKKRLALQQKKHEEEQQRRAYLHQLELDRTEKEIIALKNDKLESDVMFKNKELATITMHLVERGKLLSKIRDELAALPRKTDGSNEFRSILRLLAEAEKGDKDWEHFSTYFDEVHRNFLSKLKALYPVLSSTDLKLCAYLRINLSSKEIAQLMNISLKGVEISRYRLRKKLGLSQEVNLFDFLMQAAN
ncbi:triple tyrosine motif-containing protein [Hufsiella ginkgonis]|uniref:Transcriptional regulator n=1 Tax=Hufsiella ginkgonis TaxID=2695274 RepID=A0A7K1XZR9_9SPHI|nr:triple tyrosine motif-containing protein [Hufsiella ginkgonis]MXV16442.1 transcriptional regulator [Hufsiella ginkgonis]